MKIKIEKATKSFGDGNVLDEISLSQALSPQGKKVVYDFVVYELSSYMLE